MSARMLYSVLMGQFIGSRLCTELVINGINSLDIYLLQTDLPNLKNSSGKNFTIIVVSKIYSMISKDLHM